MDDVSDGAFTAGGKVSGVRHIGNGSAHGIDGARTPKFKAHSMLGSGPGGGGRDGVVMADIPIRLLDSFLPGYSIVSALILENTGFDISKLVGTVFVLLTLVTAARYVWRAVWSNVKPWFNSTVSVGSEDVIFEHLMFWVRRHSVSRRSRTLVASSKRSSWEADDPTDLFLVGKGAANYSPGYDTRHKFWYKGRYFTFKRESREMNQVQSIRRGRVSYVYPEQERIHISCLGRSTEPIKELIHDAKIAYTAKKASTTTVRVPTPAFNGWTSVSTRPSRSIGTLSLSKAQSTALLRDISEYLAPASARWYATHGIPYRRGYLFHGPPGTGKTSFSLVLAGMFGLDIHVLSLLDPGLTESKLLHLFLAMPSRCIVLLEDVDSAGFARKRESGGSRGGKEDKEPETISLSCLLNIIDGVASHEGRILVMTTNHPERIDPRLVRAGRVDLKVLFDFASHEQIADLFVKMFDRTAPLSPVLTLPVSRAVDETEETRLERLILRSQGGDEVKRNDQEYLELQLMAKAFATLLPEHELTPAEIQGYLLMRRDSPDRALKEAESWWRDLKEEKEVAARIAATADRSNHEVGKESADVPLDINGA